MCVGELGNIFCYDALGDGQTYSNGFFGLVQK